MLRFLCRAEKRLFDALPKCASGSRYSLWLQVFLSRASGGLVVFRSLQVIWHRLLMDPPLFANFLPAQLLRAQEAYYDIC